MKSLLAVLLWHTEADSMQSDPAWNSKIAENASFSLFNKEYNLIIITFTFTFSFYTASTDHLMPQLLSTCLICEIVNKLYTINRLTVD